ncbi:MAG: GxxExxY protein [Planctomycetes bacterium]|nr:GxxExxY protein [Planctomycetota bacterium]
MRHEELTHRIIGICIDVFRELGAGFSESVYHKALLIALKQAGFNAQSEVAVEVLFRGEVVGSFFADIMVDETVIIELKAVAKLLPEHQSQVINYLKGTGKEVGLLVNFGGRRLDFKRLEHPELFDARE